MTNILQSNMRPIRLLLLDDHILFREGLSRLLDSESDFEMVALCDRKVTAADTPAKRAARDKLFAQKYEAKSKSYLDDLRKGAMIEYKQK